jgi:UDP-3-O-[3-hydroxymyristoyl] glucosamine N-acyltransferase
MIGSLNMKLSEIARKIQCRMAGSEDVDIVGVAGIEDAQPGDLTFVANRKYIKHIKDTRASAIILGEEVPEVSLPSLRCSNPYLAFAYALELFYRPLVPQPGVHPSAVVAPDARIGPNPSIGPFAVVGAGCCLGANVVLHPHAVLYPGVVLGDDVVVHSHATVRESCVLRSRVIVQNGAVVGGDGFGFAPREDGSYYKIVQAGSVLIEEDVEIGANATIDRAAVGNTVICRGSKIDNLVQIGHGSRVGENCVLAAQTGLAGSSRLGRGVRAGGQVGFAGHLEVGDGATFTAQTGVPHDVPAGALMSGYPAVENSTWLRCSAAILKLPDLIRKVRDLEKALAARAGTDGEKR